MPAFFEAMGRPNGSHHRACRHRAGLSPRAQAQHSSWAIGAALFFSRRFEEAIPRLCVAVEERPIFPTPYRILAACYAHMGLLAEAQATVARLRSLTSEVIPTYPLPFRDPAHRELYYSGLRLALGKEAAGAPPHWGPNPAGCRSEFANERPSWVYPRVRSRQRR